MNFLRYGGIYLLLSLMVPLVLWAIEKGTGSAISGSALWAVPVLGAAMFEGQFFARAAGRIPTKREGWWFARRATGVVFLASTVLLIGTGLIYDGEVLEIIQSLLRDGTGQLIFLAVTAFTLLLAFPLNRFFFWMGARSEMKAATKRTQS